MVVVVVIIMVSYGGGDGGDGLTKNNNNNACSSLTNLSFSSLSSFPSSFPSLKSFFVPTNTQGTPGAHSKISGIHLVL